MTTEDWDVKRKLWCDVIEGIVPPNRLHEVVLRAIQMHTDTFPLAVSELIPAWNVIKSEELILKQELALQSKECDTCREAAKQNLPCPYHQMDYKLRSKDPQNSLPPHGSYP